MNPFAGILTVANPWWLIGIPLSGMALLAVYRKRSKGVRILVPSTFIWQQLAMDIQAPKKRFLPLRFLFDWLLCSLLCIAVAEVTLVQSHQDGVLIIDNSLSSFAIIPGVHGNKHVIDTIKDAAKETIRTNNSLRWSIYSTADQIQPLGTENLSASEALAIVDTVTAQYVNDEIERLFQNIRIKSPRAKVFVVTDRPLRGQALVPQQASEVITVRDNTLIWSNLALQSLALTPTADGQGQMIRARIRSYSSKTLPIEVFLKRSDRLTIPLEKKTASVPALGEVQVELPLTSITSGGFLVGFESTDARFQQNDQIAEDNTAWFAYTNVLPKISVVSPLSLKQLGLEALSAYTFVTTTLEELTKNPPEESLRAIIHRQSVGQLPSGNYLIVYPEAGNALLPATYQSEPQEIVSWDKHNSLVRYISFSDFILPQSLSFETPPWAQSIAKSASGSVLLVGQKANQRILAAGFELFPYQGLTSPRMSILTLNALQWLTKSDGTQRMFTLKDFPLPSASERLSTLSGSDVEGPRPTLPGLYQIERAEKNSTILAANFFSKRESNLISPEPLELDLAAQANQRESSTNDSLAGLFAWTILGFLVLESLVRSLRTHRLRRA